MGIPSKDCPDSDSRSTQMSCQVFWQSQVFLTPFVICKPESTIRDLAKEAQLGLPFASLAESSPAQQPFQKPHTLRLAVRLLTISILVTCKIDNYVTVSSCVQFFKVMFLKMFLRAVNYQAWLWFISFTGVLDDH